MAPNSQNFVEEPVEETPLFTKEHLEFLNEGLAKLTPQEIVEWATITIPNLYQTTAFGLSGKYTFYKRTWSYGFGNGLLLLLCLSARSSNHL